MANEHVERFLGGLNTLGSAAGAVAQARQKPPDIDATEVVNKYRQLVESGKMPMKKATILARLELSGNPGLGPTPQGPSGQGPLPPQPAPQNPQTFAQGLMTPPSSANYGGPEPEYVEQPGLMPQPQARPKITLNAREMQTIKDLGLPEQERARITAEGAKERATIGSDTRKEVAEMVEGKKGERLTEAEAGRADRTERQIEAENARALLRAKTAIIGMDQAMKRMNKQLAGLETRQRMRGSSADPERKDLITRLGQQLRTVAQLKANWDQDPQTQEMVKELWDDIKVLQKALDEVEEEDKATPMPPPQPQRPRASVGTPTFQNTSGVPQRPRAAPPSPNQMSDAQLQAELDAIEAGALGGR